MRNIGFSRSFHICLYRQYISRKNKTYNDIILILIHMFDVMYHTYESKFSPFCESPEQ